MTRIHVIDFRVPQNSAELAAHCGMSCELLERVVADDARERFYIRHEIPKRRARDGSNTRTVWEVPLGPLRDAHKAIARRLDLFARSVEPRYPHEASFGYIRGRDIRQNALRHCGAPLLLRADIQRFFPSISTGRVARILRTLGLSSECAPLLARFLTVADRLPLGLHSSPLIANLACLGLDDELSAIAARLQCTYSRYADDLSFSSSSALPSRAEIAGALQAHGFQVSDSKFRITKRGQAHYVTGLSVSDGNAPHVPRRVRRQLRLELHYCEKNGVRAQMAHRSSRSLQASVNRLDGLVRYVSGIEWRERKVLRERWQAALSKAQIAPSYMPVEGRPFRQLAFIIDEAAIQRADGSTVLALACVVTEELGALRASASATARTHRADPFAPGRPTKIDQKGLHYVDLHESVREAVVSKLATLPFQGYVAFAEVQTNDQYAQTYETLLRTLLPRRLMAADRAEVELVVEENSNFRRASIERVVADEFLALEMSMNRRPLSRPRVTIASKALHPEVAVPDCLLGVLAAYLRLNSGGQDFERLRFERLRDKYRVVIDVDRKIEFQRRHPVLPWQTLATPTPTEDEG